VRAQSNAGDVPHASEVVHAQRSMVLAQASRRCRMLDAKLRCVSVGAGYSITCHIPTQHERRPTFSLGRLRISLRNSSTVGNKLHNKQDMEVVLGLFLCAVLVTSRHARWQLENMEPDRYIAGMFGIELCCFHSGREPSTHIHASLFLVTNHRKG